MKSPIRRIPKSSEFLGFREGEGIKTLRKDIITKFPQEQKHAVIYKPTKEQIINFKTYVKTPDIVTCSVYTPKGSSVLSRSAISKSVIGFNKNVISGDAISGNAVSG